MSDRIYVRTIDTNSGVQVALSVPFDSLNTAFAIAEVENYKDRQCGYSPSRRVIVISDGFEYDVTDSRYVEANPPVDVWEEI